MSPCQGAIDTERKRFVEYDVTLDTSKEQEMFQRSGRTTVPEIFVDGELIGGCDDRFALNASGGLDKLMGH
ncbi:MAG: glutaredoxin domain-containing protein [Desulfuromonadales bacterium]|nr:glutaredoxin domain-containing protein [Desulfuromonadales bacterium]